MDKNNIFTAIKFKISEASLVDFGLYNGLMGDILFAFLYSRLYNDPKFHELGEQGLETLQENIQNIKSLNRSQGLAGIGWAIEWLQQNNFLDVDTNEVLKDIESLIYRVTSFSSDENISFEDGIIDKIVYFLQRDNNQNLSRYNHYIYMECLTYLSDDLYAKFCQLKNEFHIEPSSNLKNRQKEIRCIADILLISGPLLKARVNETICERMLYDAVDLARKILEIHDTNTFGYSDSANNEVFIQLMAALASAGTYYNQSSWIELSKRSCEIHLARTDMKIMKSSDWKYLVYLTLLSAQLSELPSSKVNKIIELRISKLIEDISIDNHLQFYKILPYKSLKARFLHSFLFFYI